MNCCRVGQGFLSFPWDLQKEPSRTMQLLQRKHWTPASPVALIPMASSAAPPFKATPLILVWDPIFVRIVSVLSLGCIVVSLRGFALALPCPSNCGPGGLVGMCGFGILCVLVELVPVACLPWWLSATLGARMARALRGHFPGGADNASGRGPQSIDRRSLSVFVCALSRAPLEALRPRVLAAFASVLLVSLCASPGLARARPSGPVERGGVGLGSGVGWGGELGWGGWGWGWVGLWPPSL